MDMVRMLHDPKGVFQVEVNIEDNNGLTPMHFAAGNGQIDMVRMLYEEFHVDVNVHVDIDFIVTPMHLAADSGQIDMVRFLIQDLGATIPEGMKEFCINFKQFEIISLLDELCACAHSRFGCAKPANKHCLCCSVSYCSTEHQTEDWKVHKLKCKKIRAAKKILAAKQKLEENKAEKKEKKKTKKKKK